VNHAWGQCGTRKYLKKAGLEFRERVQEAVIEQGQKLTGRLAIFLMLHAPTKRKYDIDNRIKPVQDALELAGVFDDDEQIDIVWAQRGEIIKGGLCRVVVVEAESWRDGHERIGVAL
jgi:crossover junction endodeoxyribonuclease RusA